MTTKKIMCGIAVLAIAVIATVNVAISNKNVSRLTDLQLANVEALADPEPGCLEKVNQQVTVVQEDVYYIHLSDDCDMAYIAVYQSVLCNGHGGICCTPSMAFISDNIDFVPCTHNN
jgi:hypothetical protein